MRLHVWPLGCRNKSAGADRVPDPGGDGSKGTCELRKCGGRVINVSVRILQRVEGRTLVSRQRNTILDA